MLVSLVWLEVGEEKTGRVGQTSPQVRKRNQRQHILILEYTFLILSQDLQDPPELKDLPGSSDSTKKEQL